MMNMNKFVIAGLLTGTAFACGSAGSAGQLGGAPIPDELTRTAKQALTSFSVDTLDTPTGTAQTAASGYGAPGLGDGTYPPGFCFFTKIQGSFGGKQDTVRIDADANGQWILSAYNGFSGALGPGAEMSCVAADALTFGGVPADTSQFSTAYVGDAVASPGFQYVPDVANGATPIPDTAINVLSMIDGRIFAGLGYDKATFFTSTQAVGAAPGCVFARRATAPNENCFSTPAKCYLAAGGWTMPYALAPLSYSVRDVGPGDGTGSNTATYSMALDDESTSFCFITSMLHRASSRFAIASITGGHSDGKWHIDVSGPYLGASASCIRYAQ